MRFTTAAVLFTGAAMAHGIGYSGDYEDGSHSTVYSTKYYTVTSCEPTVPDCPSEVTSTVIPHTMSTIYSSHVETMTHCPGKEEDEECEYPTTDYETVSHSVSETLTPVEPEPTFTSKPHEPMPPYPIDEECSESVSIKTIETYTTMVVPTVYYETVHLPCETTHAPTVPVPTGGPAPTGSGVPSQPPFTAAAPYKGVSLAAIAAGALAFIA